MNKRMLISLSTILLAGFLVVAAPMTPSPAKGAIHGVVTDPSGAVIAGASVAITDGRTLETVATDETGQYTVSGLMPGHYRVSVRSAGFSPFEKSGLVLSAGYETEADAQLRLRTLKQQITVTAEPVD